MRAATTRENTFLFFVCGFRRRTDRFLCGNDVIKDRLRYVLVLIRPIQFSDPNNGTEQTPLFIPYPPIRLSCILEKIGSYLDGSIRSSEFIIAPELFPATIGITTAILVARYTLHVSYVILTHTLEEEDVSSESSSSSK